jgi:predicted short-subunit dehydrogenase-like oxidoreductase (DUF2520 family)
MPPFKKSSLINRSKNSQSGGARRRIAAPVSIIGGGRVGTALGLALKRAGYQIDVVVTKRPSSARRAAKVFGRKTLALSALQLDKLGPAQLARLDQSSLIFATPDDLIARLARQLSNLLPPHRTNSHRIALHTSGALSGEVLSPLRKSGFAVGSLHPLLAISDPRSGANSLSEAFFSIEGDPAAARFARQIVRDLDSESFTINPGSKALYHAAALFASPHMTALFDIAVELLTKCGVSRGRARQVLIPLLESTVKNLARQEPTRALTGTFRRGDTATVRKHLAALNEADVPEALAAYEVLGRRSLAMASRHKSNRAAFDMITSILAKTEKLTID